jgi:hypothetical protein
MLRSVNWWLFTGGSGQPISPILRGLLDLWRGDRGVVPKHRWITTNLRCVTFRKSKDLICPALEALSDTGTDTLQVFKDISKINSYLWNEGSPLCARKHCLKVRWNSTCWETFATESRCTGGERRTPKYLRVQASYCGWPPRTTDMLRDTVLRCWCIIEISVF